MLVIEKLPVWPEALAQFLTGHHGTRTLQQDCQQERSLRGHPQTTASSLELARCRVKRKDGEGEEIGFHIKR
jgi:hypothetical protein